MSEKKIDLIAQLLAKAESTTPEEAEALTEHAARLMAKYMIDQATVDARRAKAGQASEEITSIRIRFTGAYRLEMVRLGDAVARGLGGIRCLMSTEGNKAATLILVGFESDIKQAETLILSLQVQAMVATRVWWQGHKAQYAGLRPYDQEAARRSFADGFGTGAGRRIHENRNQVVEEAGPGTALVLVSRDDKVQAHFDGMSKRDSRARGGKGSFGARQSGIVAGQQANTGERSMTQGRGITA